MRTVEQVRECDYWYLRRLRIANVGLEVATNLLRRVGFGSAVHLQELEIDKLLLRAGTRFTCHLASLQLLSIEQITVLLEPEDRNEIFQETFIRFETSVLHTVYLGK